LAFTLLPRLTNNGNANKRICYLFLDQDNFCAKGSQKDRTFDTDLDLELDLLRKKLENVSNLISNEVMCTCLDCCRKCLSFFHQGNKETENLRREMWSLEKQTTCKRELGSSIAEIQKLFEEKSVQKKSEGTALY
jgi:hypothetical protein